AKWFEPSNPFPKVCPAKAAVSAAFSFSGLPCTPSPPYLKAKQTIRLGCLRIYGTTHRSLLVIDALLFCMQHHIRLEIACKGQATFASHFVQLLCRPNPPLAQAPRIGTRWTYSAHSFLH